VSSVLRGRQEPGPGVAHEEMFLERVTPGEYANYVPDFSRGIQHPDESNKTRLLQQTQPPLDVNITLEAGQGVASGGISP